MKILGALLLSLLINIPTTHAQRFEQRQRVDTLTFAQRLSFSTNFIDWALLVPNVGVEFDVRNTNWSRWAVGVNVRGRWKTTHSFLPKTEYGLTGARIYVRNYYRPRLRQEEAIPDSTLGFFGKLGRKCKRIAGAYRKRIKHPKRTYYRGLFVDYSDFSYLFGGSNGKQGTALTFGITYGWLTPLVTFRNGTTMDLDLGISVGACMANAESFRLDSEQNCYIKTADRKTEILPMLSELKVGFVYRPNKYPITKRYRWRYDVDARYSERLDSISAEKERAFVNEKNAQNTYRRLKVEYDALFAKYLKEVEANPSLLPKPAVKKPKTEEKKDKKKDDKKDDKKSKKDKKDDKKSKKEKKKDEEKKNNE